MSIYKKRAQDGLSIAIISTLLFSYASPFVVYAHEHQSRPAFPDRTPPLKTPQDSLPDDPPITPPVYDELPPVTPPVTDTPLITPPEIQDEQDSDDGSILADEVPKGAGEGPQAPEGSDGASRTIQTTPESMAELPETDPSTGALIYNYNFTLPPGRDGLTPDLSLTYNSSDTTPDSYFGHGWSLNIPTITRLNKHGSDKLYDYNDFTSSFSGELMNVSGDIYAPKSEDGSFLSYTYTNDAWTVIDKEGTQYLFGATPQARKDDSADPTRIYEWYLEKVVDTNGNVIEYKYFKDLGYVYLEGVVYGGTDSEAGDFEIILNREEVHTTYNETRMYYSSFPVVREFEISDVEVRVNGIWVRTYDLTYSNPAADGYWRILQSITESAKDEDTGDIVTKNPTVFTYKPREDFTWVETIDGEWHAPNLFYNESSDDASLIKFSDVNGDAYPDVIYSADNEGPPECGNDEKTIYINDTKGGWTKHSCSYDADDNFWIPPVFIKFDGNYFKDYGTRIFDYNGDLLNDMVRAQTENEGVGINDFEVHKNLGGEGGAWGGDSVTPPIGFVYDPKSADNATQIADVNGDGLADIVHAIRDNAAIYSENIYLNTGSGWAEAPEDMWSFPKEIIDMAQGADFFTRVQIADLNQDGLADVFWSGFWDDPRDVAFINTGTDWLPNESDKWQIPLEFQRAFEGNPQSVDGGSRLTDLNGDGAIDILQSGFSDHRFALNKVKEQSLSFDDSENIIIPELFANESDQTEYTMLVDVNADGMDDLVYAVREEDSEGETSDVYRTHLSNGLPFTNKLISIETPDGAVSDISYKLSTQYRDENEDILNPQLPFGVTTVGSIITESGLGAATTQTYEYTDGHHYYNDPFDRKFAGFGLVSATDAEGNVIKTYFHQGNETDTALGEYDDHISKAGRPYRVEEYDDSGNLYRVTVNQWDRFNIVEGNDFVKLARTTTLTYDGDSTSRDSAVEYSYDDTNGNLTQVIEWGEVTANTDGSFTDIGSDKHTRIIEYAENQGIYILGLPSREERIDQSSTTISESLYYYDNLSLGQVDVGNRTKEESLVSGSTYIDQEYAYNSYGLVTSATDPNDNTTSFAYDTHNLYPETETSALGHATTRTYDYSSGQVIETTDPNGHITKTSYDGLDRPILEERSDLDTPATLVTTVEYTYNDTSFPTSVHTEAHLDDTTSVDSYTYFDGLKRQVQTRTEAEDTNTFSVTDTVYNNRGLVEKESLPYFDTGLSYTSPTTDNGLYTSYTYDALGREIDVTNAVGSTQYSYDGWMTTITNANNVPKDLEYDAYGNLIEVTEHNDTDTHTTNYEYNGNNNLTKITDANGNERSFTYDLLGRRLTAEDLHASGDTTYGTWSYSYDAASNLTSQTDPKSQVTSFVYDALNRVKGENFSGSPGVEVSYQYDTCQNGKGRLCKAQSADAVTNHSYYPHGLLKREVRTISGSQYSTSFDYDRQNNMTSVTYPGNTIADYTYNSAGLVESVAYDSQTILSDVDYGPTGAITYQDFGNGVETINTYDADALYRIESKLTETGTTTLQDLSYTYDPVGNITRIIDSSNTNAAKTTDYDYDDLNRLTSATVTNAASGDNYMRAYQYNSIGNIMRKSDLQGLYAYQGNQGQSYANPHAVTRIGQIFFFYDNNGNLTSDGTRTNTWNYRNELSGTTVGTTTLSYTYDHEGERVTKTVDGAETTYPNKYFETDGTEDTQHIYLGNQVLGSVDTSGTHYTHTDHLNSSSVVTDESGQLEQLLDYYPYGSNRIDEQYSTFDQTKRYTGHEYDESTNYTYAGARYLNTDHARWTSQDPIFWGDISGIMTDPQQLNSYSYARNNPIIAFDPGGELTIMIPGTFYADGTWGSNASNFAFANSFGQMFGENPIVMNEKTVWSGANNSDARMEAAQNIAKMINNLNFPESETLNIVGHSHGGNIAFLLSHMLDKSIDTLVTLGTPIRSDYKPNLENIGTLINVYSGHDRIQGKGGGAFSLGTLFSIGLGNVVNGLAGKGEFGLAGKVLDAASNVYNVDVTDLTNPLNPSGGHSTTLDSDTQVVDRVSIELELSKRD